MNIFNKVESVIKDVFVDQSLVIYPEMSAKDVTAWDSLTNIRLIVELEKAFEVRFTSHEVSNLKNVGDLVSLIDCKISGR